ncbi:hypothetical protein [Streptomyces sp. NPDC055793]
MEADLGAGFAAGEWRGEYTSPDGLIKLVVDEELEDWHIDARPEHTAASMRSILATARSHGLEPLDASEFEPEITEDGSVRIYLAFIEQPAASETSDVAAPPEIARKSTVRRVAPVLAIAAAVTVALLLPSPLRFNYIPNRSTAEPAQYPTSLLTESSTGLTKGY